MVSLSAVGLFQHCEQAYYYKYMQGVRRRIPDVPMRRGILVHEYLEAYYRQLLDTIGGRKAKNEYYVEQAMRAHQEALLKLQTTAQEQLAELGRIAEIIDSGDLLHQLAELPAVTTRIAQRYFAAHGRQDAVDYEVLYVEEPVTVTLTNDACSTGVVDLITRRRRDGVIHLWEHKSTISVPPTSVRLRDLQTLLYSAKVATLYDLEVDEIMWNYLRTKEPTVPDILKNGTVTTRKDLDTTWEVYADALRLTGADPMEEKYVEMRQRLAGRENSVFFPRFIATTVLSADRVLDDYIRVAERIVQRRAEWEDGDTPVMHLSRDCERCDFSPLCLATLTGGDPEALIGLRFSRRQMTVQRLRDEVIAQRAEG